MAKKLRLKKRVSRLKVTQPRKKKVLGQGEYGLVYKGPRRLAIKIGELGMMEKLLGTPAGRAKVFGHAEWPHTNPHALIWDYQGRSGKLRMPLLQNGNTLHKLVEEQKMSFTPTALAHIVDDIIEQLKVYWKYGLCHLDLHGNNIWIDTTTMHATVIDFGKLSNCRYSPSGIEELARLRWLFHAYGLPVTRINHYIGSFTSQHLMRHLQTKPKQIREVLRSTGLELHFVYANNRTKMITFVPDTANTIYKILNDEGYHKQRLWDNMNMWVRK